jgi:hypothetical protein
MRYWPVFTIIIIIIVIITAVFSVQRKLFHIPRTALPRGVALPCPGPFNVTVNTRILQENL